MHIYLQPVSSFIMGVIPENVRGILDEALSYDIAGAQYSPKCMNGGWDGKKRFLTSKNSFPTGLFKQVTSILKENRIEFQIVDKRIKPALVGSLPLKVSTLRDYQEEAVNTALTEEQGIIKSPTGSGKGTIITALVGYLNSPTLVMIHRKEIMYQLKESIEKELGAECGQIGDGVVNIKKFNIGMMQSLSTALKIKVKEKGLEKDNTKITNPLQIQQLLEEVRVFIVDETHRIPCFSAYAVSKRCKAFYKFGFSATPYRDDGNDMMLEAALGPCIVNLTASELIERGYLSKPTIYFIKFKHDRVEKHITYPDLYSQEVVENKRRNRLAVKLAYKFAKKGKKVLVAVTYVRHGKMLEAMLKYLLGDKCKFVYGESDSAERVQALKDLDSGKLQVAIATTIWGEGVNLPSLDVLINTKAQESPVNCMQLLGRTLRKTPEKDKALIIDFWDYNCRYLQAHFKARLRILQTEPLFNIKYIQEEDV